MRTTLKRGTGRANGNGRVAEPSPLPQGGAQPPRPPAPPPLGAVTRYGGSGRRGLRLTGRVLVWLLVALLVAAGSFGGGVWLYLDRTVAEINTAHSADQKVVQEGDYTELPVAGKPTTALVIGEDVRRGPEKDVGRSDTIMLVRADPKRDTLSLLSFPRDLEVDHPGCPRHPDPWRDKINTAFTFCGEAGVANTVRELTGIKPNYIIVVNFHGFKQVVNRVGGVYVDVDRRYYNDNTGPGGYARINIKPGYQRLLGGQALDYARFRHTDSDFARIARQQQFVKALKQSVQASFSITKIPGIVGEIARSLFVTKGHGKKITVNEVIGYARFLYELPGGHFYQSRINGIEGFSELTVPEEEVKAAVRRFLYPDTSASRRASDAAKGKTDRQPALTPQATLIEVQNGNGVDGDAALAANLLHEQGYSISTTGDALDAGGNVKHDYFDTVVQYNPKVEGAAAAATQVAKLFDGKPEQAPPDVDLGGNTLRVIVGQTFHGTIGTVQPQEEVDTAAATVVRDYAQVLPYLREARKAVKFTVMVPTFRDVASSLDSEFPYRLYKIEDPDGHFHDAIKLVYRSSQGYWGIEETSWTDAPILQGYNEQRRIGKRTYWLYFDGGKLHQVAFVEGGAAYWVSNTLLDGLSNRTMIAIAKGLQPLGALRGS